MNDRSELEYVPYKEISDHILPRSTMNDVLEREYVGFWSRVWASVIDSLIAMAIIVPLLWAVYGRDHFSSQVLIAGPADFLISWVLPAVAVLAFWIARQATPGKMAISATIVDEKTGRAPSKKQFVIRYLGYYLAAFPLLLGLIWVAFDKKKQGWHDKLAGTVVVRSGKNRSA